MTKKLRRLYAKLIILVLCLLIIARIFVLVLSKYESIANSYANVEIAFYLLKEDYKTMTINLAELLPQNNAYVFDFSILLDFSTNFVCVIRHSIYLVY